MAITISPEQIGKFNAEINRAHWNNINGLIAKLVCEMDCEIFGGAARDITYHDYMAGQFYDLFSKENRPTPEQYDDPTLFPETYKGRTLIPEDLDIFIHGEEKFKKVMEYLEKTYVIKKLATQDNVEPNTPYFMEKNEKLKDFLSYHKIIIDKPIMSSNIMRTFSCIKDLLPPNIYQKIFQPKEISIDIIVLKDNWKELDVTDMFEEIDVMPPFNNPDFRCNQLSLVKAEYHGYKLKANWQFIGTTHSDTYSLLNCMEPELRKLQDAVANLKIITDDIIAQRAIPVVPTILAAHRIVKMEKKGYHVDLSKILPFKPTRTVTPDDKCIICFDDFTTNKNVMKPCSCAQMMHMECWMRFMKHANTTQQFYYDCPHCKTSKPLCTNTEKYCGTTYRYIKVCKYVDLISAIEHYRTQLGNNAEKYTHLTCECCRQIQL
jgi:hypothetical protein